MVLAWLRAFGEYGAVIVLAYHPFSLPVYTYNQFSGIGLPTTVAPTALALAVAVVVVALGRSRHGGDGSRRWCPRPTLPAPRRRLRSASTSTITSALSTSQWPSQAEATWRSSALRAQASPSCFELGRAQRRCPRRGLVRRAIGGAHRGRVETGWVRRSGIRPLPPPDGLAAAPVRRGRHPARGCLLADHLHLDGLQDRFPQISGGQRQRVASLRPFAGLLSCSCWTSRSRRSTRRCDGGCDASSGDCSTRRALRPCWSPMTPKRRRSWPTR